MADPRTPDTLDVQSIADFLYTSALYAGKTDAEKRRAIKTKLDDYNFAINPTNFSEGSLLNTLSDLGLPDEVQFPGTMDGVAIVKAHYDGTTKTAVIKQGHSVCFDMTNGNCVTGIAASWGADEYKVVGIALKDYSVVNTIGLIPIRLLLVAPPPENYNDYAIVGLTTSLAACPNWGLDDDFTEGSGNVYLPKKQLNGKYRYEPESGAIKILNNLPFSMVGSPGSAGLFHATYLDGDWLIKRPVNRDFSYAASFFGAVGSPLGASGGGGSPVISDWSGSGYGAVIDGISNQIVRPNFLGSLYCRVYAMAIMGIDGDYTGHAFFESRLALTLPSGTVIEQSRHVLSLADATIGNALGPYANSVEVTHHIKWEGIIDGVTHPGFRLLQTEPSMPFRFMRATLSIVPSIQQP